MSDFMRDATAEEHKSTSDYVKKISKRTNLRFDEVIEEIDFVQKHPKVKVKLRICEDCISREDARMCITMMLKPDDTIESVLARVDKRLRELPSVEPLQKKGKWIRRVGITDLDIYFECSECGKKLNCLDKDDFYCSKCGSDNSDSVKDWFDKWDSKIADMSGGGEE